jgi:Transglutaminase-like superfamily
MRGASHRRVSPALFATAALAFALSADASPILHERVPSDPRDDMAMRVVFDGNIPAAIETPSGLVSAPDPLRPAKPPRGERASAGGKFDAATAGKYEPDTDTRRPDLLPYDEPFTPSTAPFKRLVAFDAVDSAFHLVVENPVLEKLPVGVVMGGNGAEERFFADIVVAPTGPRAFRIPSVGPGARVLHARLGSGARDIPYTLLHDGADNWFIETSEVGRLVMEVTIPRAAFGGELGDPGWSDLRVQRAPAGVRRDANKVAAAIGLDRTSPRAMIKGMVSYFRGFADSNEPPSGHGNVYLDLALSKKGVCRHRAYAFTVTALGLGIPARMIMNEAHAWVEVHDGSMWRRIDLGGAGRTLDAPRDEDVVPYQPPPDPYDWPPNAESGEDLGRSEPPGPSAGANGRGDGGATPSSASANATATRRPDPEWPTDAGASKTQAASRITVDVRESDLRRGAPLHLSGEVESGGDACARVTVEIALRDAHGARPIPVGSLATDDAGKYSGVLIVPSEVPAGDYDVVAHTPAATACAEGFSR